MVGLLLSTLPTPLFLDFSPVSMVGLSRVIFSETDFFLVYLRRAKRLVVYSFGNFLLLSLGCFLNILGVCTWPRGRHRVEMVSWPSSFGLFALKQLD